uniref:Uncharacterized protein n=1 Tax=Oryza meridionalis TaxID=40149 RepID=A0A0E0C4V9_9ORYZ
MTRPPTHPLPLLLRHEGLGGYRGGGDGIVVGGSMGATTAAAGEGEEKVGEPVAAKLQPHKGGNLAPHPAADDTFEGSENTVAWVVMGRASPQAGMAAVGCLSSLSRQHGWPPLPLSCRLRRSPPPPFPTRGRPFSRRRQAASPPLPG